MSSNQQISGTSSGQSDDGKAHREQLFKDHIPHFLGLTSRRGGKRKVQEESRTARDLALTALVERNGDISQRALYESELAIKDKAFRDIQESRGYNTGIAYCAKQVEFLSYCEERYASRPISTRYQANGDNLLSFLYEKVPSYTEKEMGKKLIINLFYKGYQS